VVAYAIAGTNAIGPSSGICTSARSEASAFPPVDIVSTEDAGWEQSVEQAALQHACQAHPMVERGVVSRAVTRMRPHSVLNMADVCMATDNSSLPLFALPPLLFEDQTEKQHAGALKAAPLQWHTTTANSRKYNVDWSLAPRTSFEGNLPVNVFVPTHASFTIS
jgi:hypothetical protein